MNLLATAGGPKISSSSHIRHSCSFFFFFDHCRRTVSAISFSPLNLCGPGYLFFFVLSFPLPGLIPLPEVLTPGSLLKNMACIKGFRVRDEQVSCGLLLQEEKRRCQRSYRNRWVCFKNLSLFSGREEINVGRAPCKKGGISFQRGACAPSGI